MSEQALYQIGVGSGGFVAEVKTLLQIGRRTGLQNLAAQWLPAAFAGRIGVMNLGLEVSRKRKEAAGFTEHCLAKLLRNTVVGDVEKALVEAGGAAGLSNACALGGVIGTHAGEADDWGHRQERMFFFKKKNQKTFVSCASVEQSVPLRTKVFCFSFSKKKAFLSSYPQACCAA
jgi:hypothetical protein